MHDVSRAARPAPHMKGTLKQKALNVALSANTDLVLLLSSLSAVVETSLNTAEPESLKRDNEQDIHATVIWKSPEDANDVDEEVVVNRRVRRPSIAGPPEHVSEDFTHRHLVQEEGSGIRRRAWSRSGISPSHSQPGRHSRHRPSLRPDPATSAKTLPLPARLLLPTGRHARLHRPGQVTEGLAGKLSVRRSGSIRIRTQNKVQAPISWTVQVAFFTLVSGVVSEVQEYGSWTSNTVPENQDYDLNFRNRTWTSGNFEVQEIADRFRNLLFPRISKICLCSSDKKNDAELWVVLLVQYYLFWEPKPEPNHNLNPNSNRSSTVRGIVRGTC